MSHIYVNLCPSRLLNMFSWFFVFFLLFDVAVFSFSFLCLEQSTKIIFSSPSDLTGVMDRLRNLDPRRRSSDQKNATNQLGRSSPGWAQRSINRYVLLFADDHHAELSWRDQCTCEWQQRSRTASESVEFGVQIRWRSNQESAHLHVLTGYAEEHRVIVQIRRRLSRLAEQATIDQHQMNASPRSPPASNPPQPQISPQLKSYVIVRILFRVDLHSFVHRSNKSKWRTVN